MQMANLLPVIAEKSAELVRLVNPQKSAEVARAVFQASLAALERVLLDGAGRYFVQDDGEALDEDLQALLDLFSLNLNNCLGYTIPFEEVETAATRLRSLVELLGKPVHELIVLYRAATGGLTADGPGGGDDGASSQGGWDSPRGSGYVPSTPGGSTPGYPCSTPGYPGSTPGYPCSTGGSTPGVLASPAESVATEDATPGGGGGEGGMGLRTASPASAGPNSANPFDSPSAGGNPFDDPTAPPPPPPTAFNPFDAPPPLSSTNPFDLDEEAASSSSAATAAANTANAAARSIGNPFGPAAGPPPPSPAAPAFQNASATPAAPTVPSVSAAAEEDDGTPPPERCPTDLLRVLLRRAEPAAKEFLRSLRQSEERERRRSSLPVSDSLPGGPLRVAGGALRGASLLRGFKSATAGLETKVRQMQQKKPPSSDNSSRLSSLLKSTKM